MRAGLDKDPVFGKLTSLSKDCIEWMQSRYKKTCPACAKKFFTSPRTLPVCTACWKKLDTEVCLWWWLKSGKTPRALEKLLDAHFDGGYDVEPDYHQLKRPL